MAKKFLIDTNVLIKYLNGSLDQNLASLIDNINIEISIITKIEILSWSGFSEFQKNQILIFLSKCRMFSVEDEIIETVVGFRNKYKLKIPDAIIAATAFYNNMQLVTLDKDFANIKGLRIISSIEI
ncbi:MAG: type II toxin-antitoxin system VapC family toxin [Cytophagaceae bacterium]|nr:type II toxin-antitoxin system VapC family toxin [Cytophagaceae bacterium]MBK9934162.1 type II toxin-antitoxin system VapC family toxin [Cytophagaceae bacterium]MBL0300611.1 type II toxin-antitoxin system VapC family toxin [Cytophagaceae bacterium]MBL0327555.1 type II toxin-antitoxin system VapC family toxin [Cytophagaceae bacterium]